MLAATAGGLVRAERLVEVEPKRHCYRIAPVPPNDRELEEAREAQRGRKTAKATIDRKREQGRLNDIVRRERSRERKKNMKKTRNRKQIFESDSEDENDINKKSPPPGKKAKVEVAEEAKVEVP